jgi:hypothetical protein
VLIISLPVALIVLVFSVGINLCQLCGFMFPSTVRVLSDFLMEFIVRVPVALRDPISARKQERLAQKTIRWYHVLIGRQAR